MIKITNNIRTEQIKRIKFIKSEIKRKILKSTYHNNNHKNNYRLYSCIRERNFKIKLKISRQHKVCLWNGRNRGVFKHFNASRHTIKKLGIEGRLQNLKTMSW